VLTLTENASTVIHDLTSRAGLPDTGGLRIAESGEQQGSFELALVAAPHPEDEVVTEGTATVYLAPAAAVTLSDQCLDVDSAASQQGAAFTLAPQ